MQFLKRAMFFILTNVGILVAITIVAYILEQFFGLQLSHTAINGYVPLLIWSAVVGFTGALISLATSRMMAKSMYGIDVIREERLMDYHPKAQLVYTVVARIAQESSIVMPEVGVYESSDPNAFATGPTKNRALVAVSSGLLEAMTSEEIEGVIGHEMAHVMNGDMVTMTLLQGVLNTFVVFASRVIGGIIDRAISKDEESSGMGYWLSSFILEIIFGIFANIALMTFSRYREYRADEGSSRFLGKTKMIRALKRLQTLSEQSSQFDDGKIAALKIASPSSFLALFSSHPKLEDRIRNLEENVFLS